MPCGLPHSQLDFKINPAKVMVGWRGFCKEKYLGNGRLALPELLNLVPIHLGLRVHPFQISGFLGMNCDLVHLFLEIKYHAAHSCMH